VDETRGSMLSPSMNEVWLVGLVCFLCSQETDGWLVGWLVDEWVDKQFCLYRCEYVVVHRPGRDIRGKEDSGDWVVDLSDWR
jgi:hypothetical protein